MMTSERLREVLDYQPLTGIFRWKVRLSPRGLIGAVAGCKNQGGYWCIGIDGALYVAHRLAWLHHYGEWPQLNPDHEDNDPLNNRIANLRPATASQNAANSRRKRNNKSGYKGVSWHKTSQKYRACIMKDGKEREIGYFDDPVEAHEAYVEAAKCLHGEFARAA